VAKVQSLEELYLSICGVFLEWCNFLDLSLL